MSGLSYASIEDCPPGLRRLIEAQHDPQPTNAPDPPPPPATNKYHAKPTEVEFPSGRRRTLASKKEASYYRQLRLRAAAGEVRGIRMQVDYLLQPGYIDGETGERYRSIVYRADYVYEERAPDTGQWRQVIVDVKGGRATQTPEYKIKRKLMAAQGYHITEI